MPPITTLSASRSALRSGAASPIEVLAACGDRIEQSEALVRAWSTCDRGLAQRGADRLDAAQRSELPLWGIPIGIKDIVDVARMPTATGSRVLAGTIAHAGAPVVARLRAAGAVIVGKTNT